MPGPRSRNHTEMFLGRMVLFSCPSAEQQEPDTGTVKRCCLLVLQFPTVLFLAKHMLEKIECLDTSLNHFIEVVF